VKDIALDVTSVKFERNYRGCPEVYVASTNAMKLEAVRRFYPHPFRVFGVSEVASGVPEQPFGKDETVRGAHNRLNALKKIIGVKKEVTRVFVAIENGIVQEGENYDDIAIVAWCQDNGIDAIFTSHKVKIPKETYGYVERALAEGTTYGSLIEKAYGIPKGEWHMKLARVSRIDQILSAIKMMRHPM
jgi:non-canonical (house-cleaning) NTP pyrophosphatase